MSANLRIFVSSTCSDLFQERRDLCKALLDLGHSVILSEFSDKIPVDPRLSCVGSCLTAIENHTDLLCLVISGRYGATDSTGRSITAKEYLRAKALGIPTLTFVRQRIWDLIPLFKTKPTEDFSPTVEDNRVFELIEQISGLDGEHWIFTFNESSDIVATIRYQLSCLLRTALQRSDVEPEGLQYRYANNYSTRLNPQGWCHRSLEYYLANRSEFAIERITMGDTSDLGLSTEDFDLRARDSAGNPLGFQFVIDTEKYRRWELIFPEPIRPGGDARYFVSYRSSDVTQMQTGYNLPAQNGFIRYLFPSGCIGRITDASIRDPAGWHAVMDQLTIHQVLGETAVFYGHKATAAGFQFRLRWTESNGMG